MSAQVTATGIRDGDPAVLHALVNRRGAAVLAYCERACPPSLALDAAADAFARFRAMVLSTDRPTQINPEGALLSATRHAAAARAPRPPAKGGATGLGRLLGGKGAADRLPDVPDLLADRADGTISDADAEALDALLAGSPVARSIEERFTAAEEAYRTAPRRPLPEPVVAQIVATMGALASAPGNGAPQPDPLPSPPRFFHTEPSGAVADPFATELRDESAPAEPEAADADEPGAEPDVATDGEADATEEPEATATEEPEATATEEPEATATEESEAAETEEPEATATEESEAAETEEPDAPAAEEPVDVDAAVPDSAEIAAARADEAGPAETEEWTVPGDELGEPPVGEREIAAARLEGGEDEDPAHLQSASGAVPEDDVPAAPPPVLEQHHRHLPGRAALAPAAAVVAIAAVGAMAASGVFGGNDPSPTVDTGIVPERALQAVPEGEAAAVVDDLRAASADARRRRLADQRQQLAAQQVTPEPAPGETDTTDETAPAPEADATEEPTVTGETSAPEAENGTPGGTDATGGGDESP